MAHRLRVFAVLAKDPAPMIGDSQLYVYGYFVFMYGYAPCGCLVPVEARRGHQIPWNWRYRTL